MESSTIELPLSVTKEKCSVYLSTQDKTREIVEAYAETDQLSHRYIAYRDLPSLMKKYLKGKKALDYGSGTGISASYLQRSGLSVVGVDINKCMLEKAQNDFPDIKFFNVDQITPANQYDLVFSSFVLFDMKSKQEIISYLDKANSFLNESGIIIAITGSEELYSCDRKWIAFESNFSENRNLQSGDVTKLRSKNPPIEFYDYYWKDQDYVDCCKEAGLKVLEIYKPTGSKEDPYLWEDEIHYSPFTVYVMAKS